MGMKYAFVTTIENSFRSFMLPYAKKLKDDGYDVYVVCNFTETGMQEFSADFNCVHIDITRGFDLKSTIVSILELRKFFRKEKIDVVEYGTENAAFCASIAANAMKVPVRIYDHWGARYVGFDGFLRKVSIFIEKVASSNSTDIRQVSVENMNMCIKDGLYTNEKVSVLGKGGTVGVDTGKFDLVKKTLYNKEIREQYGISIDSIVLGFVGRIQSDKGINELLTAFKNIQKKNKPVILMLIGAIDYANPVNEELLKWAETEKKVIFTGQVRDVYKYMSCFDVLVHPTYREGFGMVLQEAAALKIPIITTRIMGPREFIIDQYSGELVDAKNAEQLEIAMCRLLEDSFLRMEYAERIYEYTIKYFERSVMVDRIIKDREKIISERIVENRRM